MTENKFGVQDNPINTGEEIQKRKEGILKTAFIFFRSIINELTKPSEFFNPPLRHPSLNNPSKRKEVKPKPNVFTNSPDNHIESK